jgi:hypothetical protein
MSASVQRNAIILSRARFLKLVGLAVTLQTCIREVLGSNPAEALAIRGEIFRGLSRLLHAKAGIVP